jgi:tetratricopeptide (TPR) repeat protein
VQELPEGLRIIEDLVQCETIEALDQLLRSRRNEVNANLVNRLGQVASGLSDPERALWLLIMAERASILIGDGFLYAETQKHIGKAQAELGRFREAISALANAVSVYRDLDDAWNLAFCLSRIGLNYQDLREYSRAIENLERAATLFHELGDTATEALQLGTIGVVRSELAQYDLALSAHEQALDISKRDGLTEIEAFNWRKIGQVHTACGRRAQALRAFDRALQLYRRLGKRQLADEVLLEVTNVS